jgi:uncharacterized membrane protein
MSSRRFDSIDLLRGMAIVWMTLYHFCFDLNQSGYLRENFYLDTFWTTQRTLIVSMFLFCAGLAQAVALQQGQSARQFARRLLQIGACALLVTAGSWIMFPKSFIYFGVLHGIALMLLMVRLTASWGQWLWGAGAAVIMLQFLAPYAHSHWPAAEFLNDRAFNWLGLVSRKPVTEDYVPLVPWLGVMWWGTAAGQWLLGNRRQWLSFAVAPAVAPLTWLGRWSLTWYMLHQLVLIGTLNAIAAIKAH